MTTPADELQQQIYRRMTPAQKWRELERLRETAWTLKAAGVRMRQPDWTPEQVEAEVKRIFLYATT